GARVGFAFGGGPPAGQAKPSSDPAAHTPGSGGYPFLPFHLEFRAQYWFLPLTAKLFRAYGLVGGGLAQVDAKVPIGQYDCEDAGKNPDHPEENTPFPVGGKMVGAVAQCASGVQTYYHPSYHPRVPVDAWSKMGRFFLEFGAGGMLAVGQKMGVTLEAKVIYMMPDSGVVLEPVLGVMYGF
ncbi:MAG TPA: hypothetical protein VLJ38_04715, partial [Polyangiaceae bacterium]|nr:hypothetical protein [Polyangiaceae bacterium]